MKKKILIISFVVVVVLAGAAYIVINYPAKVLWFPNGYAAYQICAEEARSELKSPATAIFPKYSSEFINRIDETRFSITSYYDAQNGFGAMLRGSYNCVVDFIPFDKTYGIVWVHHMQQ